VPDLVVERLNWLDVVVLVGLAISAIGGVRRGFLFGVVDLAGAALALVGAFLGYEPVSAWLTTTFPNLPPMVAGLIALLGLVLVIQFAFGFVAGLLVRAIYPLLLAVRPLLALDRLLGLLPGLARGVILVTLLLLPFAVLPVLPVVGSAIEDSTLASRLVSAAMLVAPEIENRLGADVASGLSGLILTPPTAPDEEQGGPIQLGPLGTLTADPAAEQQMLELVNQERQRAGLRPLAADETLRGVARAHSREMFERSYFAHDSPTAGSPYDRMRAAGISFFLAGENLAYAPNVQTAHQGLMRSPGHRANILRREFARVGIGVIHSQFQGSMFTQDFRN
jgi:uncharacterized protein YkwD/uncharacterized membrane protein required for colicin V production